MSVIERARELRRTIEGLATQHLGDDEAIENVELFPAWDPTGHAYAAGDRIRYQDLLYKVLQAHTSQADWTPDTAVSLYVRIDDPAEEWPEWRQPAGAHDAYEKGAHVSHNEKHWESTADANVWEPGVYGWEEM